MTPPDTSTRTGTGARTGTGTSRHQGGPASRYGSRRTWTRPAGVTTAALLAVAGGGWLLWAALHHADPDVASRLESFNVQSPSEVSITIAIEREAATAVTCVLQAQASDHAVVGVREIAVPPGPDTALRRTYVVTTEREATTGVLDGCRPG